MCAVPGYKQKSSVGQCCPCFSPLPECKALCRPGSLCLLETSQYGVDEITGLLCGTCSQAPWLSLCNKERKLSEAALRTQTPGFVFIVEVFRMDLATVAPTSVGKLTLLWPLSSYSHVLSVFSFQGDSVVLSRTMRTSVTTPSSSKSAGRWGAAPRRPRACYLSLSPPPLTSRTQS